MKSLPTRLARVLVIVAAVFLTTAPPALADTHTPHVPGVFEFKDTTGTPAGNYTVFFGSGLTHTLNIAKEEGVSAVAAEPLWTGVFHAAISFGKGIACAGIWVFGYFGRLEFARLLTPLFERLDIVTHTLTAQLLPVFGVLALAGFAAYLRHVHADGRPTGHNHFKSFLIAALMCSVLADPFRWVIGPPPFGLIQDAKAIGDYASSAVTVSKINTTCATAYDTAIQSSNPAAFDQLNTACGSLSPDKAAPGANNVENFLATVFVRDFIAYTNFGAIPEHISPQCSAAYTAAIQHNRNPRNAIRSNCGSAGPTMYTYSENLTTKQLGPAIAYAVFALFLMLTMIILSVRVVITFIRMCLSGILLFPKGIAGIMDGTPREELRLEWEKLKHGALDFIISSIMISIFAAFTRLLLATATFDPLTGMIIIVITSIACAVTFITKKARKGHRTQAIAASMFGYRNPTTTPAAPRSTTPQPATPLTPRTPKISGTHKAGVNRLFNTATTAASRTNPALAATLHGAHKYTRKYAR